MELFLIIVGFGLFFLGKSIFKSMWRFRNQKQENAKWLINNGFNKYSIVFNSNDAIGIDYERSKVAVISKNVKSIIDFKDILSVEVTEPSEMVSNEIIYIKYINIFTKKRDLPFVKICGYGFAPINILIFTYQKVSDNMTPWYARLIAIIE